MPTGTIEYQYNAAGEKLQKKVVQSGKTDITDYIGGYQYVNNVLQFVPTIEGYYDATNQRYVYQYKDHLGNVRVSYYVGADGKAKVDKESNYYPFGLEHKGYNAITAANPNYKYRYNGKEMQNDLGLNTYDYGARHYEPSLGRWFVIDPQAQLQEIISPYAYALNSPIIYLDKDGELPILINGKVGADDERANEKYWTEEIINTIKDSGIPNPGGQFHYVDGDRGQIVTKAFFGFIDKNKAKLPQDRIQAGKSQASIEWNSILSKLEKDPKTGKIIEKIQIYTHSRGSAFGQGYTEQLLKLIKENSNLFADASNVIDFVLNLAPHQSNFINSPNGIDGYSIDRTWDMLSGNDMQGLRAAFQTNSEKGNLAESHRIKSFQKELSTFLTAFLSSKGDSNKLMDDFVKKMQGYGIKVNVKK